MPRLMLNRIWRAALSTSRPALVMARKYSTPVAMPKAMHAFLTDSFYAIGLATNPLEMLGKGVKLSALGEIKVNDQAAVGVRVSRKGRRDVSVYFDKKTGLTVKTERRTIDLQSDQEITEERIVTEYQKLDGVPHPKKMTINRDGKKFLDAEILELKEFDKLDEGMFKVP